MQIKDLVDEGNQAALQYLVGTATPTNSHSRLDPAVAMVEETRTKKHGSSIFSVIHEALSVAFSGRE